MWWLEFHRINTYNSVFKRIKALSIYREGIKGSLGCNSYNLSILKVFSDERIHQSVTNVSSAMFNTQFQALNNDGNISTY